jgi:proton-dependent oligopeptide transporter, POT family
MADTQANEATATKSKSINPQSRIINYQPPLEENVPSNVSTQEQLALVPDEFLSMNKTRPLKLKDDRGAVSLYFLKPMVSSVIFILMVELLERFAFYGINYTQTSFLTGAYNRHWNAELSAVSASSYVSISTAIAYTAPFGGAVLADCILGEYWTIMFGALVFYVPGILLIALTTVPYLLGPTFNLHALSAGLLFLWPIGTGIVKAVVNVFGAKQFHPFLQSSLVESYYVSFYMCINIGALAGGIIVPIIAEHDVTLAYMIPVCMLMCGVSCFLMGTPRYVIAKPRGDLLTTTAEERASGLSLWSVVKMVMLIVPFCVAYSQMATTFIVQGTVMQKAFGFIDAASMNNADAVAVLFFGYWIGGVLYPLLAKHNIKIPTTYKFALGSAMGSLAILWALFVEYKIHSTFKATGDKISVLWQTLSFALIGLGEIFVVSSAYEAAFKAAPPRKKALASAINLFAVGGLPNMVCIVLYNVCSTWFHNAEGRASIRTIETYTEAHVGNYFWVLFFISLLGVAVNVVPSVRDWVDKLEESAAEAIKTPRLTPKLSTRKKERAEGNGDETSALLRTKQHQKYLEYGSGPLLYKSGSMRAAPFLNKNDAVSIKRQQKMHEKFAQHRHDGELLTIQKEVAKDDSGLNV